MNGRNAPGARSVFSKIIFSYTKESNSYTEDHTNPNLGTFQMSTIYNFWQWPIALYSARRMWGWEQPEKLRRELAYGFFYPNSLLQRRGVRQDSFVSAGEPGHILSCSRSHSQQPEVMFASAMLCYRWVWCGTMPPPSGESTCRDILTPKQPPTILKALIPSGNKEQSDQNELGHFWKHSL